MRLLLALAAAALVGTFVGVLLAYGVVGPIAKSIESRINDLMSGKVVAASGSPAVMNGINAFRPSASRRENVALILDI